MEKKGKKRFKSFVRKMQKKKSQMEKRFQRFQSFVRKKCEKNDAFFSIQQRGDRHKNTFIAKKSFLLRSRLLAFASNCLVDTFFLHSSLASTIGITSHSTVTRALLLAFVTRVILFFVTSTTRNSAPPHHARHHFLSEATSRTLGRSTTIAFVVDEFIQQNRRVFVARVTCHFHLTHGFCFFREVGQNISLKIGLFTKKNKKLKSCLSPPQIF